MQLCPLRKQFDTRRCAVQVIAGIALVFCCGGSNRAAAQEPHPAPHGNDGRIWYEQYCTPCHGVGGGPGTAVFPDSKQPVDLRTYVQRHHGFPSENWLAVMFGPPVRNVHRTVVEKIRSDAVGTAASEIEADGMVDEIAAYLRSIQSN